VQHFWPHLWSEAAQDYRQGGIDFDITDGPGEVRHSPADNPVFVGLRGRAINLVVTDVLSHVLSGREVRVDYYATRLWLFHDGEEVRQSGEAYLRRLRASRL
jgi:hypothetical protein